MLKDWKLITNETELEGKTILKACESWDKLYITFTDQTYCYVDTYDYQVSLGHSPLDYFDTVIHALGMLSKEELAEKKKQDELIKANAEERLRSSEIQKLKELAARYPDEL